MHFSAQRDEKKIRSLLGIKWERGISLVFFKWTETLAFLHYVKSVKSWLTTELAVFLSEIQKPWMIDELFRIWAVAVCDGFNGTLVRNEFSLTAQAC